MADARLAQVRTSRQINAEQLTRCDMTCCPPPPASNPCSTPSCTPHRAVSPLSLTLDAALSFPFFQFCKLRIFKALPEMPVFQLYPFSTPALRFLYVKLGLALNASEKGPSCSYPGPPVGLGFGLGGRMQALLWFPFGTALLSVTVVRTGVLPCPHLREMTPNCDGMGFQCHPPTL